MKEEYQLYGAQMKEEYQLYYVNETDKAICVCQEMPDHIYGYDNRFYLPKSQINIVGFKHGTETIQGIPTKYCIVTFECPEWLAKDKGLI